MKRTLAILAAVVLAGCTTTPPIDLPPWVGKYGNACLPEAIAMSEGLKKSGIQAKVLSIHTDKWGHAVCVYMYPPGHNQLWAWDSYWQSFRLRAWWDDPTSMAKAWLKFTKPDAEFRYAVLR